MRFEHVRRRALVVLGALALSIWAIYPPDESIKLGLDLAGGVQLVLRVDTDAALAAEDREETVQQAIEIVDRRVNAMGVAESVVARYAGQDRILVELPGVTDVESAKAIIRSTAQLRLTLVEQGPFPSAGAAAGAYGGTIPSHLEVLPGPPDAGAPGDAPIYIVWRDAVSLEAAARQVTGAIEKAALPAFEVAGRDLVSASIGEDLQRRGIYATLASIAAIAAYVGFRFRFAFAAGAVAATLHDILVTIGCLALAGYDLSLNVTAALLTITGYSVNDTIVVFDRVRENLRSARRLSLDDVVNLSVRQTLSRTIITAGTTFLAALALFLFGGEALEGFAFTMLVGVVSGTYSTIFIASAMASALGRRQRRAEAAVTAP